MADLIARSPAEGLLPKTVGALKLTEAPMVPMWGISPHAGEVAQASSALETACGLSLPGPGRMGVAGAVAVMWFGRNRWLVIGAEGLGEVARYAAVTDQSDAWVSVSVGGAAGAEVMARLVPVDLRASAFPVGSVVRTEVYHMQAAIARTGAEELRVLCFRSMAGTLVHDLVQAGEAVAARAKGH
ncbi:sarcosine oxidase subunit gamma [Pseudooceanicola sp. LIPI14-2-Ac024]|uniref:sarcosine oxidase subunit gamma n=1 Tax=Pseudooceanicola sp. LIPI14-2-Ac024 TaxID=3344875 RepID=UPI0035CF16A6